MYRSSTTPPACEDPARWYRAEHVTDAILALPAPINTAYWENRNPWVLMPDDDSDDDTYDDSDDEVEDLVVLSDEVEEDLIVQLLAPIIDVVEGDKNRPIDVEKVSGVADLPEVVVVNQEVEEDVSASGKKKRAAEKNTVVRRSERVKMLKKEE
ncbi:MATE efflux family protein 3, chloroplastic [Hordeum vulgare]|nr:MATE efflux family protein 3, chloroplastic [Hordeum vulgare]